MYIVTFYSYRGGVGRTTALVNVAAALALQGRKVLLVDFDLEAPSLASFDPLRPEGDAHPGVVEFIEDYLHLGKAPDVAEYVYEVKGEDCLVKRISEKNGKIWVMPAGRSAGDDYWRAFHQIDWKNLCDHAGVELFEDLKSQWNSFHPDYVLVDARAGINDRLAICTRQLPNAVVALYTPNSASDVKFDDENSLFELEILPDAGMQRVLKDVIEDSLQSSPPRIEVMTVATKVPPELHGSENIYSNNSGFQAYIDVVGFEQADDHYEQFFPAKVASIPHAPELLLSRQIVTGLQSKKLLKPLFVAYQRLADALIDRTYAQDRKSALAFLKSHKDDGDGLVDKVIKNFSQDPEILALASACLFDGGRGQKAIETLDEAVELQPRDDVVRSVGVRRRLGGGIPIVFARVAFADVILWQRASYCRRMRDFRGAIRDLFRLLDSDRPSELRETTFAFEEGVTAFDTNNVDLGVVKLDIYFPGIDPYVALAVQMLRWLQKTMPAEIDAATVEKALQTRRIQQLPPEIRKTLVDDAPMATYLGEEEDAFRLIAAKEWHVAISLLEDRLAKSPSPDYLDVCLLAMAYWGAGENDRACQLCGEARAVLESDLEIKPIEVTSLLALVFWKAGDTPGAKRWFAQHDDLLSAVSGIDEYYDSYWRFQRVEREVFTDDRHSLLQMIHEGPPSSQHAIHPLFLGKEPPA